jgi:hypothetical protein
MILDFHSRENVCPLFDTSFLLQELVLVGTILTTTRLEWDYNVSKSKDKRSHRPIMSVLSSTWGLQILFCRSLVGIVRANPSPHESTRINEYTLAPFYHDQFFYSTGRKVAHNHKKNDPHTIRPKNHVMFRLVCVCVCYDSAVLAAVVCSLL